MTPRNTAVGHDTEDKEYWCRRGLQQEVDFCDRVAPLVGLAASINPEKATDQYAIDLIVDGRKADLKCQNTPFFTAAKYAKDPALTETFNKKDLTRYEERYPEAVIYFYVRWDQTEYPPRRPTIRVPRVEGVWATSVVKIRELIDGGRAPLHEYQRRVDDREGNARDSFLLSLKDLDLVRRLS